MSNNRLIRIFSLLVLNVELSFKSLKGFLQAYHLGYYYITYYLYIIIIIINIINIIIKISKQDSYLRLILL